MIDIQAVRRDYPLPAIVGASIKLDRTGAELKGCCPFHAEKSPSFTIFAGGQRFYCFGCGAAGDVLDYLQRIHGVGMREAAKMLDGGSFPVADIAALSVGDKADRSAEAKAIWRAAQPIAGTLAETYLRSRSLRPPFPLSLRFTRLRYGQHGLDRPVLIAAVASADDKLIGVQRTYLRSDGMGKAEVPKPKLSLGRVSGGAVRLAPRTASIIVCEGIEDGLTVLQDRGVPVWVAAGASMMPNMIFPAEVREVIIAGDGDAPGREAARKASGAFAGRGLSVRTLFPAPPWKDFNAELMGRPGHERISFQRFSRSR